MIESFKEYPFLWLLAAVLLLAAVGLLWMAHRNKKNAGDSPELLLSAKDVERLRHSFSNLTKEKLDTVHGREMVYAVVTNIEARLDAGTQFGGLSKTQQFVYTLWYFTQSIAGDKGLCQFFKEFEAPLTDLVVPALMELDEPKLAALAHDAYRAFDSADETASCDPKAVEGLNASFHDAFDRVAFFDKMEQFVRANIDAVLDVQ